MTFDSVETECAFKFEWEFVAGELTFGTCTSDAGALVTALPTLVNAVLLVE